MFGKRKHTITVITYDGTSDKPTVTEEIQFAKRPDLLRGGAVRTEYAHIYTQSEVKSMTPQEFSEYQERLAAQFQFEHTAAESRRPLQECAGVTLRGAGACSGSSGATEQTTTKAKREAGRTQSQRGRVVRGFGRITTDGGYSDRGWPKSE